ncbi:host-nuclease inhibitor Gam family protein [Cytobacillus sp. Sa5YUA1]|uniref:Host-nuclease inhibitor Gam family protein n=1 Tax=Cytobacillus stercorigallinarum TaxID=2762240 RepID=A0ABR8QNP9_9BACI|nr:host-nuclease inhibitor Gam family protein [Cytobacillus stercorigallinarum]MBD7937173.1 host-nuclease inhibitor Gam family protein [Cytobacillus stercorigallinarum]
MNQLQQIEMMEVEEIQSQETPFEISDLNSLNWAFRKLAALKSKEKEIKQLANVERDRIALWERGELSTIEGSVEFFENMISVYHAKQLESDPKAKTITTPYGKSKTRKSKEAPEKANEEEILQHVIENNMDDYIKNSVKWADLKKNLKIVEISGEKTVVDENGQLIPGVTVKPESISYSVEV